MVANRETQRRRDGSVKRYTSYCCSRYLSSGRCLCSRHRVYEIGLKELVFAEIKTHAQAVELDAGAVFERIKKQALAISDVRSGNAKQEAAAFRRRVWELEQIAAKLYEDKVNGVISEASFTSLIGRCESKRAEIAARLERIDAELSASERESDKAQRWADAIRRRLCLQELDRETVDELIDHIEIGERSVIDGQKHQDITVYYRFVGAV